MPVSVSIHPVTPDRWHDMAALFGEKGACAGCWCMFWRAPRKAYTAGKGDGNKLAMQERVIEGKIPGLLGYIDGEAVAWVSVAPKEEFDYLARARTMRAPEPDGAGAIWTISCLFIAREWRNRGLSKVMIGGAVDYARAEGARWVEGYPNDTKGQVYPAAFVHTGLVEAYLAAGFEEVARPSAGRPIVRITLNS